MLAKHADARPDMKFLQMDLLEVCLVTDNNIIIIIITRVRTIPRSIPNIQYYWPPAIPIPIPIPSMTSSEQQCAILLLEFRRGAHLPS